MANETGGSAFPDFKQEGMTVRDYFAAHAPACPDWFKHESPDFYPYREGEESKTAWINKQRAAKFFAWRGFYADCMIAERAK